MKKWQVLPAAPAEFFAAHSVLPPLIAQLLFNRGLKEKAEIALLLNDEIEPKLASALNAFNAPSFYDPFLFRDMAAAVDLIIKHIKAGNKIVVYGDYDADGVTSSVILLEALQILHAVVDVYLPDRVSEGYGLNKSALKQIAASGVKLVITVDTGIRNKEEVAFAKQLGLEIIITDHHILPEGADSCPDCLFINPSDESDRYPWRYLAGVGVAFKLVSALLIKSSLEDKQKKMISDKCLDLVAVGTVADMVNLLGENRLLVKQGLKILNQNRRFGLNELLKISKANGGRPLEAWNIGWQIAPRLNAASRLAHANTAFGLLTTTDESEAQELAAELNQRNISRQQITEEISAQVEAQIDKNNPPLVIVGIAEEGQIWNEGVVGLVAGRIAEKYYRPTLVITRLIEEAEFDPNTKKLVPKKISFKGSGRSVEGFNLIAAIEQAAAYLDKYGGHPMACGFSIKSEENLIFFKKLLLEIAAQQLDADTLIPKLKIEAELEFSDISLDLAEQVGSLAPFGQNNQQPRFASYNLRLDDVMTMGFDNQHIKLRFSTNNSEGEAVKSFWAIAFGAAATYKELAIGDYFDLAYYLEINDFNGRKEVQLKIVDIRPAQKTAN